MTRSKFIKVKCECGNEQIIFKNATSEVKCLVSSDVLATPAGGKMTLTAKAKVIEEYA